MKLIKIILIGFLLAVALLLLAALLLPSSYQVERSVSINKSKDQLFSYLVLLKNQDNFSVWMALDPNVKKTYQGEDGTVGFVSAWQSEKQEVGAGEQEIKAIRTGERIDYELRFLEPFASVAQAYMQLEPDSSGQTKVSWGFQGHMPYPMNLLLLVMDMEGLIGRDLQQGLDKLKVLQEQ
jgi:hypothetical protein